MKKATVFIALSILIYAGCSTPVYVEQVRPERDYKMTANLSATETPGQYQVEFIIWEGNNVHDVLTAPKITVLLGEPAEIKIYEKKSGFGIFCTALVIEKDEKVILDAKATIKQPEGIWSDSKTIIIKR